MATTRRGYEDLEVWKLGMQLAHEVHTLVSKWESFYRYKHGQQWLDVADSIAANVAEGYGRFFYYENRNFCFYARGSLYESKTWLIKANDRSLIDQAQFGNLYERHETLAKKLNNYVNYIEAEVAKNKQATKST